jgi:hypothetical protein
MALDHNAGNKRTVSLARNLSPQISTEQVSSINNEAVAKLTEQTPNIQTPSYERRAESVKSNEQAQHTKPIAAQSNRTKKVSFLADPKLEERFRKARLRAGFDKLEDAYNEALTVFCEQVEKGKIDRF